MNNFTLTARAHMVRALLPGEWLGSLRGADTCVCRVPTFRDALFSTLRQASARVPRRQVKVSSPQKAGNVSDIGVRLCATSMAAKLFCAVPKVAAWRIGHALTATCHSTAYGQAVDQVPAREPLKIQLPQYIPHAFRGGLKPALVAPDVTALSEIAAD